MFNRQFSLDMRCEKYQMFQVSAPDVLIMNCRVILAITASSQSPEPFPSLQGCTLIHGCPLQNKQGTKGFPHCGAQRQSSRSLSQAAPLISPKGRAANPQRALAAPRSSLSTLSPARNPLSRLMACGQLLQSHELKSSFYG